MLKNILKALNESDVFSKSNIANNLNITEDMVDALLQQLISMGYVNEDLGSPTCETSCGRCPYAKMCHKTPVNMYGLTEKGKKALVKN